MSNKPEELCNWCEGSGEECICNPHYEWKCELCGEGEFDCTCDEDFEDDDEDDDNE